MGGSERVEIVVRERGAGGGGVQCIVSSLQVVPTESVSRHCQLSSGSKTALVENYCLKSYYVSGEMCEQVS